MKTNIVERELTYLLSLQQRDGSFLSLSSSSPQFTSSITYQTTFTTSLILLALHDLPDSALLSQIRKRAVNFLLSQKSEHWSWNYWARGAQQAKDLPYPDDLDDTFCALAALFHYDPLLLDGKALAHIVQLLTATETKEGGPYRTWLVDDHAAKLWKDRDLAVNSNIAYFLSLQDIRLPNLLKFIDSSLNKKQFISTYYPTIYPVIYFLSRAYQGKQKTLIQNTLLAKRETNHSWGNPLFTALAVRSLLNLDIPSYKLTKSIHYLLNERQKGHYKPYPFCFDPTRDGKKYVSGSSAVTTAFCLGTLFAYEKKQKEMPQKKHADQKNMLYQQILLGINQQFLILDKPLQKEFKQLLKKLLLKDADQTIALLPYYFSLTLGKKRKAIPDKLLVQLGIANIFGWIAYTVYDDFLDEEGTPKQIPIANIALREVMSIYEKLLPTTTFALYVRKIMNKLDYANFWEVTHTRFIKNSTIKLNDIPSPSFKNLELLAQKSFGHALGPIAILFSLGYNEKSQETKNLAKFFREYLIVKQINDDAHDWEQDLQRGQINVVASLVLKKNQQNDTLKKALPRLQKIFWFEVIPDIAYIAAKRAKRAEGFLKKCTFLDNTTPLEDLLFQQTDAIQKALKEQERTRQFLQEYK